ncbi:MAG: alanine racemase [Hyphomonadaceae bacterium]
MIPKRLDQLASTIGANFSGSDDSVVIERIAIDSKGAAPGSLFVALSGRRTDGHRFVEDAFENGASAAVVSQSEVDSLNIKSGWTLLAVPSPLTALQQLATRDRIESFEKVVAITGSNGKTIVKDALATMLGRKSIFASPVSYNSQLGVPLSVLSCERRVSIGVFEAATSAPGEMSVLQGILSPDFGVLTNIGMAHYAAFGSQKAIAFEKMKLFENIPSNGWVVLPNAEHLLDEAIQKLRCQVFYVGAKDQVLALHAANVGEACEVRLSDGEKTAVARIAARAPYIVSNLHAAATAAYLLGATLDDIAEAIDGYVPPATRLEIWSSPDGIRIINDAHSSDPLSARAALGAAALGAPEGGRKFFVFAEMRELGDRGQHEHRQIGAYAAEHRFDELFLVGNGHLGSTAEGFTASRPDGAVVTVSNYSDLKAQLLPRLRRGDVVLFKGPRNAGMAQTAREIAGSLAQRTLWVDLAAIKENVARLHRHCGGGQVRIMAMLKALAYGTDLAQHAYWLAGLGVQHIGVSSTSEGIAVRKTGATQDIFVFLPDRDDIKSLARFRLVPVLYSSELIDAFAVALAGSGERIDVHLKIDTGMHRLGVSPSEAIELARKIERTGTMRLTGVCTHFAAADEPEHDERTRRQIELFKTTIARLRMAGFDNLIVHAANTAATIRFPDSHFDMVRVGLGLYGLHSSEATQKALNLSLAIGVTSRIASAQTRQAGESIGYGYSYTAGHSMTVATVPFGYNDGIPWRVAGQGHVLIDGKPARIVGRVSMDQMQIDITEHEGVTPGSEVLIYGAHNGHVLRPETVAEMAGTIPHELLIRLGQRVHRVYLER